MFSPPFVTMKTWPVRSPSRAPHANVAAIALKTNNAAALNRFISTSRRLLVA
jgi:hypothetical protein